MNLGQNQQTITEKAGWWEFTEHGKTFVYCNARVRQSATYQPLQAEDSRGPSIGQSDHVFN